jgi:CheY-like chemotaxis protein
MMLNTVRPRAAMTRRQDGGRIATLMKPIIPGELWDALRHTLASPVQVAVPAVAASRAPIPAPGHGCSILVAEDNPVNQRLVTRLLEKRGYVVVGVETGEEALRALTQAPFDLVLMDVQMPEMDGCEATGAIRAREQGTDAHLPIIALTAHAMKDDREKCLAAGMDAYLTKPIKPEELYAAIERLVTSTTPAGRR